MLRKLETAAAGGKPAPFPFPDRSRMKSLWIASQIALVAVALRVIDVFLLKRYMDRPGIVVAWFAVAFALVLLTRHLAGRIDPDRRGPLARGWLRIGGTELVFIGLLLVLILTAHWGYMRARSDGRAYFIQVRSLVEDLDLDFANDVATFGTQRTVSDYALGTALRCGIEAASHEIVVFADADATYDFGESPELVAKLEGGYDMVVGSRLRGSIEPGAMPWMHRYVGTPLLTFILNRLFADEGQTITDCNSGFRCFRRDRFRRWNVEATGMEFASQMLVRAMKHGARIALLTGLFAGPVELPWFNVLGLHTMMFALLTSCLGLNVFGVGLLLSSAGRGPAGPYEVLLELDEAKLFWGTLGMLAMVLTVSLFPILRNWIQQDLRFLALQKETLVWTALGADGIFFLFNLIAAHLIRAR